MRPFPRAIPLLFFALCLGSGPVLRAVGSATVVRMAIVNKSKRDWVLTFPEKPGEDNGRVYIYDTDFPLLNPDSLKGGKACHLAPGETYGLSYHIANARQASTRRFLLADTRADKPEGSRAEAFEFRYGEDGRPSVAHTPPEGARPIKLDKYMEIQHPEGPKGIWKVVITANGY